MTSSAARADISSAAATAAAAFASKATIDSGGAVRSGRGKEGRGRERDAYGTDEDGSKGAGGDAANGEATCNSCSSCCCVWMGEHVSKVGCASARCEDTRGEPGDKARHRLQGREGKGKSLAMEYNPRLEYLPSLGTMREPKLALPLAALLPPLNALAK
jgi:hypothetical protein